MRRTLLALLALAACTPRLPPLPDNPAMPPGIDWTSAQSVEVVLDEYRFTPDRLVLRVNQPVRLRLVNRGARGHDFSAPGFFATATFAPTTFEPTTIDPGQPTAEAIRAARGTIDVPAHATREIVLAPLSPGTWALDCDKPLHGMFGMTGEITVLPAV